MESLKRSCSDRDSISFYDAVGGVGDFDVDVVRILDWQHIDSVPPVSKRRMDFFFKDIYCKGATTRCFAEVARSLDVRIE